MTRSCAPELDVVVESERWPADAGAIVRRAIMQAAQDVARDVAGRATAILLTDDAAIRELNARFRGIDKPTNVLSFPAPPSDPAGALGDIAIAFETTAREAALADKPLAHHLSHLAVHGFLHLIGYDHAEDAQAEEMELLERRILGRLGVPDPYAQEASLSENAQA
ncbi:MAG TPA: rRNA maturation RNase YbeY [Xanthobacteraceae bacterium]|nr:rRNA maturation RNase YbeY [Xanthobacteraceae bacterium]